MPQDLPLRVGQGRLSGESKVGQVIGEGDPRPESHATGASQEFVEIRAGLDDSQTLRTGCWQGQQSHTPAFRGQLCVLCLFFPHNFPKPLALNFSPTLEEQTQNVLGQHLRASAHNRV